MNRLEYRRQFLLAREPVQTLDSWNRFRIASHYLYVHPDLPATEVRGSTKTLILLGDLFDPSRVQDGNREIVSRILETAENFEGVLSALKPTTGRYAVLFGEGTRLSVLHDPFGVREIYYCTQPNRVICGSQPNLLDAFSEPKLGKSRDPRILNFYENEMKHVRLGRLWVGDETIFTSVKHLIPNHYLDVGSLTSRRYWPDKKLERLDFHTAVERACGFLQGFMKAVTSRYDVMIAVTAGFDSRSLLAASREVRDRVYYFINKEPSLNDQSPDIRVPKAMFEKLQIPFHIHEVGGPVDEEFKKVFLNNVFWAIERPLPTIFNVYYKNHQDKVNLLGLGEIGRVYYGDAPRDLDGYLLARSLKYRQSGYAVAQCEQWLRKTKGIADACHIDIMKIFLLENLIANWGAIGNAESDIAIEELDPYSSHDLIEIMLSYDQDQGDIFKEMFKRMWPELLDFPLNPPDSIGDRIKEGLRRMGLFSLLQRQLYRMDRRKFRKNAGSLEPPAED